MTHTEIMAEIAKLEQARALVSDHPKAVATMDKAIADLRSGLLDGHAEQISATLEPLANDIDGKFTVTFKDGTVTVEPKRKKSSGSRESGSCIYRYTDSDGEHYFNTSIKLLAHVNSYTEEEARAEIGGDSGFRYVTRNYIDKGQPIDYRKLADNADAYEEWAELAN